MNNTSLYSSGGGMYVESTSGLNINNLKFKENNAFEHGAGFYVNIYIIL